MSKIKVCAFFGHRDVKITENLKKRVRDCIENLILKEGVTVFLFGSRSNFDALCHASVTELKELYPQIERRAYTCGSETCILESERKKWEKIYADICNKKVTLLGVETEVEHETKYAAGKASYVERNKAMIDDSDCCVFYYRNDGESDGVASPAKETFGFRRSGTALAHAYALKNGKTIINVAEDED